jgi:hypothetical protein
VDERVPDCSVDGAAGPQPDALDQHTALEQRGLRDDASVGIDNAADPGVGRPCQPASLLDRPESRLFEVLYGALVVTRRRW